MNLPKLKVLADPRYTYAGAHPYHKARFIVTEDCTLEVDDSDGPDLCDHHVTTETGSVIAEMTDCEQQAELARVMAAATELLEALTVVTRLFAEKCTVTCMFAEDGQAIEQASAAIAKAKGQP